MVDLILKIHGADATGILSEGEDKQWRAHLLVRDLEKEAQQTRGPEMFGSMEAARAWIIREASHHGFGEADFEITVEAFKD